MVKPTTPYADPAALVLAVSQAYSLLSADSQVCLQLAFAGQLGPQEVHEMCRALLVTVPPADLALVMTRLVLMSNELPAASAEEIAALQAQADACGATVH
jgi:hypothetical protein